MSTRLKTLVVLVLPIACMLFLSVSIVCLTVSLNPGIRWNEYNVEVYPGSGLYAYYYNTLWESIDVQRYEGKKGSGIYMPILHIIDDDSWKDNIRFRVRTSLGLTSGSLFLLIMTLVIHAVSKEKLFVVISTTLSATSGLTGGSLCFQTISDYKNSIIKGILDSAAQHITNGGYYYPELEVMKLGYLAGILRRNYHYNRLFSDVSSMYSVCQVR